MFAYIDSMTVDRISSKNGLKNDK